MNDTNPNDRKHIINKNIEIELPGWTIYGFLGFLFVIFIVIIVTTEPPTTTTQKNVEAPQGSVTAHEQNALSKVAGSETPNTQELVTPQDYLDGNPTVESAQDTTIDTAVQTEDSEIRQAALKTYNELLKLEKLLVIGIRTQDAAGLKNEVHYPLLRMLGDWPEEVNDSTRRYSACYGAISKLDCMYSALRETSGIKRTKKFEKCEAYYHEDMSDCAKALDIQ